MTPGEIITAGLDRAGAANPSTAVTNKGRLYLNLQLGELWVYAPWRFLYKTYTLNTSASTRTYALNADVESYEGFYDQTNDNILLPAPPSSILRADPNQDFEANPRWYAPATNDSSGDQQVDFYPTPDGTYTLLYEARRRVPVLASGDDGNTLDDEVPRGPAQTGLIHGIASMFLDQRGNEKKAARELGLRDTAWNLALSRNRPNGSARLSFGPRGTTHPLFNVDTYGLITEPS